MFPNLFLQPYVELSCDGHGDVHANCRMRGFAFKLSFKFFVVGWGEKSFFLRFDHMILCSFLWRIRWKTPENHSSKEKSVYDQISFFFSKNFKVFSLSKAKLR